jgi:primosomal protein N' (replication factor Y)
MAHLEARWGNARAAARKLEGLGVVALEQRAAPDDEPFADPVTRDLPHDATPPQAAAIEAIAAAVRAARPATYLLHGVTGSGKTEVYLRAIAAAREAKRGSIVLVQEIALAPVQFHPVPVNDARV